MPDKFAHLEPRRRLVYHFFELPYHTKVQIALDLCLLKKGDIKRLGETKSWQELVKRAVEQNQLAELWEKVAKQVGLTEEQNPFKKGAGGGKVMVGASGDLDSRVGDTSDARLSSADASHHPANPGPETAFLVTFSRKGTECLHRLESLKVLASNAVGPGEDLDLVQVSCGECGSNWLFDRRKVPEKTQPREEY